MPAKLPPDPAIDAQEWGERYKIVWNLRLSTLYHQKRERFFDKWDRGIKAFAVIGGAAAVSQLIANPNAKLWIAAAVSVVSTVSLVFGLSQLARRHADFARDYCKLLAKVEEAGAYPGTAALDKFRSELLALEATEPATLSALVRHCENLLSLQTGDKDGVITLSRTQYLLMHCWDFSMQEGKARAALPTVLRVALFVAVAAALVGGGYLYGQGFRLF